jgi:hypothetical protein
VQIIWPFEKKRKGNVSLNGNTIVSISISPLFPLQEFHLPGEYRLKAPGVSMRAHLPQAGGLSCRIMPLCKYNMKPTKPPLSSVSFISPRPAMFVAMVMLFSFPARDIISASSLSCFAFSILKQRPFSAKSLLPFQKRQQSVCR